jgi:predicted solute-binding protein
MAHGRKPSLKLFASPMTRQSAKRARRPAHLAVSPSACNGLVHGGAVRAASVSSVTPATADRIEAMKTAILAASKSASD